MSDYWKLAGGQYITKTPKSPGAKKLTPTELLTERFQKAQNDHTAREMAYRDEIRVVLTDLTELGWSYGKIAKMVGLSKTRVFQIVTRGVGE